MKRKKMSLWALAVLSLASTVQAVDTTFTGTLTDEQTYIRPLLPTPFEGSYLVSDWTAGNETFNYLTRTFIPGGTGTYTIRVTQSGINDPMIFVYSPTFDSLSPLTNGVIANDDTTYDLSVYLQGAQLTGGQTYIIVVTSYQTGDTGDFTFVISGDYGARVVYLTTLADPLNQGVALVMENSLDSSNEGLTTIINSLMLLNDTQIESILPRLSPQTGTALRSLAFGNTNSVLSAVSSHLNQTWGNASEPASDSPNPVPLNNVWTQMIGNYSLNSAEDGFAGYRAYAGGIAVGLDRNVGKGFTVGDAIAFLDGKADMRDYRDGDTLKAKTYQTTVYAIKDFGKWFVQGNLTGAIHKFESTRETVISGIAKSEFDGKQLGAEIGTGIRLDAGRFTITPSASFNCDRVWVESYKENGAGALSLSVNSSKQTQARSALGGRITTSLKYNTYVFTPFAHAYWQHDFTSHSSDLTASFVGGSDEFVTHGQSLNRDQLNTGIGIGVSRGNLYAQISYAAEVDRDNVAHAVQIGISMMF